VALVASAGVFDFTEALKVGHWRREHHLRWVQGALLLLPSRARRHSVTSMNRIQTLCGPPNRVYNRPISSFRVFAPLERYFDFDYLPRFGRRFYTRMRLVLGRNQFRTLPDHLPSFSTA